MSAKTAAQLAEPATSAPTQGQVGMDLRFVNAFLQGTIQTLKIQCTYEVKSQKSFVVKKDTDIPTDIVGVIGLTSSVFSGSISLCFPAKFFLGVMGSMFGETYTEITDELADGAGELLNIIFGTAKTVLNAEGMQVEKAIPTVVRGKDMKLNTLTQGGVTIAIPFEGKDGLLHILVGLDKPKNNR